MPSVSGREVANRGVGLDVFITKLRFAPFLTASIESGVCCTGSEPQAGVLSSRPIRNHYENSRVSGKRNSEEVWRRRAARRDGNDARGSGGGSQRYSRRGRDRRGREGADPRGWTRQGRRRKDREVSGRSGRDGPQYAGHTFDHTSDGARRARRPSPADRKDAA